MKLSDYVVDFLAKAGAEHNFLVTGGAVLHLVNSTAEHPGMQHVCVQHEQFGAAAADGYSRSSGKLGVAMATSGPGATNFLTSICNAYFDSIPMVCITGQVATFRLRKTKKLRQKGFQETDVSAVFKSVTKYVKLIEDPFSIRYELEKALYIAREGRPGPVVLDIPDDLQRIEINPTTLKSYHPHIARPQVSSDKITTMFQMIKESKCPVIVFGAGVHCAHAEEDARRFARYFKIPVLLTWGAADLFSYDDELNMGGLGICGPRAGNFAVQQADLIIAMGTRLSQMITGGKQNLFAPRAKKIMIDIDIEELNKFGSNTFVLDLPILAELKTFFSACESLYEHEQDNEDSFFPWREKIQRWRKNYPICLKKYYEEKDKVNPYVFVKELSKIAREGDLFFADTGANLCWIMQAFETKKEQRIFSAWNHTPMGYALPASIGATFATKKEIICLIGDGGLMMCLQEFATIRRHELPIKVFIFDNQGLSTIKQTIDFWLKSHYVAVDEATGLSFPNYQKLAETFKIPYFSIKDHENLSQNLKTIFEQKGPLICQLHINENQRIVPMLKFGGGLEDLDPRLSAAEIAAVLQEYKEIENLNKQNQLAESSS